MHMFSGRILHRSFSPLKIKYEKITQILFLFARGKFYQFNLHFIWLNRKLYVFLQSHKKLKLFWLQDIDSVSERQEYQRRKLIGWILFVILQYIFVFLFWIVNSGSKESKLIFHLKKIDPMVTTVSWKHDDDRSQGWNVFLNI